MRTESTAENRAIVTALIAAAVIPYLASIGFGFVLDDTTVLRSNPALSGWGSLVRVWTVPYGGLPDHYTGLYRPLTMMLFALVWNLGGHWAVWFHLLAIALHAVASLMVLRVLSPAVGRTPALLSAFWFAVHPVHVEAIANVSNSSEVLVAIWTCLLARYLGRLRASAIVGWREATVAGLLYLAAFLSKESGAMAAPLAAIWLWGWVDPGVQNGSRVRDAMYRWWRVLSAWVVVAAIVFVVRWAVLAHGAPETSIAATGLEGTTAERMWRMLSLGPKVAELLAWPTATNPHYGPTAIPAKGGLAFVTVLGVLGLLTFGLARAGRGDRRFLAGLSWTLLAYLPASNLLVPTGQVLAERTLYLSTIGVAMMFAFLMDAIEAYAQRASTPQLWYSAFGVSVIVVAFFLARATAWTIVWRTNHSLFEQMVAADPNGYRGYWLQAQEARYAGNRDEAVRLMERAYALYPRDRGLLMDYSIALTERGNVARARAIDAELAALDSARARGSR